MRTAMTYYFETSMLFETLLDGVKRYGIAPASFFILQPHEGKILVATNADLLVARFNINPAFKSIALTRDDLYFRMGDMPVISKAGNPNLMPFI
jgi:hypothetical protein